MTEAGVEFAGVSFAVGGRTLLDGISLTLKAGTTTALLGRSGSGKTTLMRTVNGLVMPTSGSVRVGGKATAEWDPLELRRGIGYVIQESGLFPHWTVARNVGLALELRGGSKPRSQKRDLGHPVSSRVEEVMGLAGLDAGLGERYPWQLSGGQRQRVGLARALAGDPSVLLMDEPFGALDPMTRAEMQDMLLELLKRVQKTVLLVTHDLDEALYLAGRVVFLDGGRVVADLASAEVMGSENEYVRRYVAAVHREPTHRDGAAMNGAQGGGKKTGGEGEPTHRDEAAMNGAQGVEEVEGSPQIPFGNDKPGEAETGGDAGGQL